MSGTGIFKKITCRDPVLSSSQSCSSCSYGSGNNGSLNTGPPADRQDDTLAAIPTGDKQQAAAATQPSHTHVASFRILAKARNNAPWTPQDDRRLVALRVQGCTWGTIASILSRHRTACSRRYDQLSMNGWPSDVVECDSTGQINPMFAEHSENRELLFRLVNQGTSWKQIGYVFGLKANVCQIQWRRLRRQMDHCSADKPAAFDDQLEAGSLDRRRSISSSTSSSRSRTGFQLALTQAVQDYGPDQWETISQQVFDGKFSPAWLRYQYVRHEQERTKWTKLEDQQLLSAVRAMIEPSIIGQCSDLTLSQWEIIASGLGGQRAVDECRKRWRKLRLTNPSHNNTCMASPTQKHADQKTKTDKYMVWTDEASARLKSLVPTCTKDEHGKRLIDWLKVEDGMKPLGYTKSQCKARWNRMIKISSLMSTSPVMAVTSMTTTTTSTATVAATVAVPSLSSSLGRALGRPWEQQEIEALLRGVADLGDGAWARIQRKHLPNRLDKGIQGKWNGIMRKLWRESFVNLTSIEHEAERTYGPVARRDLELIAVKWPHLISKAEKKHSLEKK
ncbi:hypothetical protein DFQ27_008376 [Actinomortierella ambigua]|uniref:Myb-like domain-containing protein n=1 Tax=Actinomortierella ambigua TaxID=1343610 RepID=A0A9P6QLR5_9FUNG|nr:hypothetical protein DFQ27_008376 [Actinomortierella ambigua]